MNSALKLAISKSRMLRNEKTVMAPKVKTLVELEDAILALTARVIEIENRLDEARKRPGNGFDPDQIPMTIILRLVSQKTGIKVIDLKSNRRSARVSLARHIFMYVARHLTGFSLPTIGRFLKKDHTTVMHGIERIEQQRMVDLPLNELVNEIADILTAGCESPEMAREARFERESSVLETEVLPVKLHPHNGTPG